MENSTGNPQENEQAKMEKWIVFLRVVWNDLIPLGAGRPLGALWLKNQKTEKEKRS